MVRQLTINETILLFSRNHITVMLKERFLLFLLFCSSFIGLGQEMKQNLIGSGGDEYVASSGVSMNVSFGDLVTNTYSSSYDLTCGFQQTGLSVSNGIDKTSIINAVIFPNPTTGSFHINSSGKVIKTLISDINGKLIQVNYDSFEGSKLFNLSEHKKGFYLITISLVSGATTNFKLCLN